MLVEKHKIEDTPFDVLKWSDERGEQWIVALKQYRLTPSLPSREAAEHIAQNPTWNFYMAVMNAIITEHEANKTLDATIKRQAEERERHRTNAALETHNKHIENLINKNN